MSLHIGRVTLDEGPMRPFSESWSDKGRQVTLGGSISTNSLTLDNLARLHDDIMGLPDSLVPVSFDVKDHRNGYYMVQNAKSSIVEIGVQQVMQVVWEISLVRQGADNQVDIESRLAGPVNRLNDHVLTGSRWHAPSQAHEMYWAESATPSQVIRVGSEGNVRVYTGLTQTVNPRWHCDLLSYPGARVRLYDTLDNLERSGIGINLSPRWGMQNTLVKFDAIPGGGFNLACWDSASWSTPKKWNITLGGTPLGDPVTVVVLRNEYELVTVRVMWDRTTSGRVWSDFILRRGSRFIEMVMKANASGTLGVVGSPNEAGTLGTGYVRATSNDAGGNRYVVGSARSFTNDLTAGGISKAAAVRFDAFIGFEFDGSSAITGDGAAALMAQYLGSPAEVVMAVNRGGY